MFSHLLRSELFTQFTFFCRKVWMIHSNLWTIQACTFYFLVFSQRKLVQWNVPKEDIHGTKNLSALERFPPWKCFACSVRNMEKSYPKNHKLFRHTQSTLYLSLIAKETSLKTIWHKEINFTDFDCFIRDFFTIFAEVTRI